nr:reverse transcriptase domain-containing protein [Tanacetum cinerariifolium]
MSSSTVTYTSVYTNSEPGRVYWVVDEEPSDRGSPRVILYGYDALLMHSVAPPSLDYVPGPEHPPSLDYIPGPEHPPSPIYVPKPEYLEYLVPSGDDAPVEDQPLPPNALPTALSPGYVADSDLDKDPKEDPEEDHADGGDGDNEPSNDDDDDDDTDDEDDNEEEEEEHLAPTDSFAIHVVDHVPSAGDTEVFETDESAPIPRSPQTMIFFSQTHLCRVRKTVRPKPPIPTDAGAPLGYREAGIRMRALLPPTSPRIDILEAEMPPRKRSCLAVLAPGFEVGESSAASAARQLGPTLEADLRCDRVEGMGYGITDTYDEIVKAMLEVAPTTFEGVNQRVTELATTTMQETEEFQVQFEDAQDDQAFQRVRVNTLFRDKRYHHQTVMLLDREATYARRAWASSEDRNLTTTLGRIEALEATYPEPQDEPAEAGSSFVYLTKMAPRKRTTRTSPATTTTTTTPITDAQLRAPIARGVAVALTKHVADMSRNVDDSSDSGTGERRQVSTVRDNCNVACQVKFANCTLQGNALTWWNSHVRAVGHDVAYAMPWKTLRKMMADKYCPRSEIKKLETEMWNLKVKGTDVMSYNQHFQDLVLMCDSIFPEESNVVEKYVEGLPDMIHGSVKASKPKTMQEAIEFATELMDKKSSLFLNVRLTINESLRRLPETTKTNNNHSKGIIWHGLTLLRLVRRNRMEGLNLCALNATITMMGRVLPSVLTAKGLAIRPVIVKASMLLSPTTRELKGQIKESSLALSVELKQGLTLWALPGQTQTLMLSWNASPTLKDLKFWTTEEKKTQKIDRLARYLLIQELPNDIYSLIDSNETAKDLWDALERQMRGSEYAEQDRKAAILYEYETFKATEGEQLLDTYLRYLQVINDLKKCGYKKDNCDVNDALGYKKKAVVVTLDPLALVAKKTKVSKRKEKVEVQSESEESDDEDISDLKKITALLAKPFNRKKYYAKPTNNNLRTSSSSSSVNKKPEYVKSVEKKKDKRANEKKRDMSKVKCYNCKKEGHFAKDCKKAKVKDYKYYKTKMLLAKKDSNEQVLLAEDQAWMESSSESDQEINANMVFMAQIEKVLSDSDESSSSAKETIDEQTSSLKPYVSIVILEKIIIDLEDEVVSLLEKEKANLKTIKSLKLKGLESSENAIFESENQSENDCQVVEKECDQVENSKVIASGMFKLSVSQSVSPISVTKTTCDSKNVENKTKRKRRCVIRLMRIICLDDESVRISPVSKMPFRKKPRDSLNVRSKHCPDLSLDHRFGMFKAYDG